MRRILKYLYCGMLGMTAYLISVRISLTVTEGSLLAYRGIDTMGQISLQDLPHLIFRSYSAFILFFTGHERFFYVTDFLFFLYIAVFLLAMGFLAHLVLYNKIYKNPVKITVLILLTALLPLGLNITDVLAPETLAGTLNIHQFVLSIVFLLVLCEVSLYSGKLSNLKFLSKWTALTLALLISVSYIRDSSLYYFKLHITYERTYAFYNRVLARVEQVDGFRRGMPIAPIGNLSIPITFEPALRQFPGILNDQGLWGQFVGVNQSDHYKMITFFAHYLGVQFSLATQEQFSQIREHEDFINMPVWPHKDSVAVIDGIIVIRLNYCPTVKIEPVHENVYMIRSAVTHLSEDYMFA